MKKSLLTLSVAAIMSGCGGGGTAPTTTTANSSNANENPQVSSQTKQISYKASDAYVVKLNSSAKLEINGKIYESHKVDKNGTIIFNNIPKNIDFSKATLTIPDDAIVDTDFDGEYNASIDKQIRMPLIVKGDAKVANPIATAALEHNDTNLYEKVKNFDPVKAKEQILSEDNKTLENLVTLSDTIAEVVKAAKENNITKNAKEVLKDINITACKEALQNKDENATQVIEKVLKPLETKHKKVALKVKEKAKAIIEVLDEAKIAHKQKGYDKKEALKAVLAVSDGDANATAIKTALKEGKKGKDLEDFIKQEIEHKKNVKNDLTKENQQHSNNAKDSMPNKSKDNSNKEKNREDMKNSMPNNGSSQKSHNENNETLNQPITQIDPGNKENNHTQNIPEMPIDPGQKEEHNNKQKENNASKGNSQAQLPTHPPIDEGMKKNKEKENNTTTPHTQIDPGMNNQEQNATTSHQQTNSGIENNASKAPHQNSNNQKNNSKEDNNTSQTPIDKDINKTKNPSLPQNPNNGSNRQTNQSQANGKTTKEVKIKASDAYVVALPTAATLKVGHKEFNSTKVEANGTIVFEVPNDLNISKAYFHIPKDAIVDADGDGNLSEADQIIRMPLLSKGKNAIANPLTTVALNNNATTLYEKIKNFDPVAAKEELIKDPNNEHLKKLVVASEAIAMIAHKAQNNDANVTEVLNKIDFDKLQTIIDNNASFQEVKPEFAKIFKDAKIEAGIDQNITKKVDDFVALIKEVHKKYQQAHDKKLARKKAMLAILAASDGEVDIDVAKEFDEDTIKNALRENASRKVEEFLQKHQKWLQEHQEWMSKHQAWVKHLKDRLENENDQNHTNSSWSKDFNHSIKMPRWQENNYTKPHFGDFNKSNQMRDSFKENNHTMPHFNDVNRSNQMQEKIKKAKEQMKEHNITRSDINQDLNKSQIMPKQNFQNNSSWHQGANFSQNNNGSRGEKKRSFHEGVKEKEEIQFN